MDCLVGPISSHEHLQQKAVSAWEQKTKGKSQSAKHEDLVLLLVLRCRGSCGRTRERPLGAQVTHG